MTSDLEGSTQLSEAVTEEATIGAAGRIASNATDHVMVTGRTCKGLRVNLPDMDCNAVACSIPSKSPSRNNWSPDMCKTKGNWEQVHLTY